MLVLARALRQLTDWGQFDSGIAITVLRQNVVFVPQLEVTEFFHILL